MASCNLPNFWECLRWFHEFRLFFAKSDRFHKLKASKLRVQTDSVLRNVFFSGTTSCSRNSFVTSMIMKLLVWSINRNKEEKTIATDKTKKSYASLMKTSSPNMSMNVNTEGMMMDWSVDIMMNCFCGMVDGWKTLRLVSSWDDCQRLSPQLASDTL